MVSSFSSMTDINSSAFMKSASMSFISSESLIKRNIRIIIVDHCMFIKGFSNLVFRVTYISAPQFECCWGYPSKSASGQDSPKTLPSWFSAKARIRVWDFFNNNWQQIENGRTKKNGECSLSSISTLDRSIYCCERLLKFYLILFPHFSLSFFLSFFSLQHTPSNWT